MNVSAHISDEQSIQLSPNVEEFWPWDGATPIGKVVEFLDNIAGTIPKNIPSLTASRLASELNLSRSLYQDRDRFETVQLRGQILSLLSGSYVPDEAIPFIDDILRNSQDPRSRAEAALAAGFLGPRGHKLVPALLRVITASQFASPVALGLLSPLSSHNVVWTNDRLQAISALGRIGNATDECTATLHVLASNSCASAGGSAHQEGVVAREALEQLALTRGNLSSVAGAATQDSRSSLGPDVLRTTQIFTDQNGEGITGARLMGKPSVIAFFYTSCRNPGRCSTTALQVIHLRQYLTELKIETEVNVSLITLEPEVDDPARLRAYGDLRGMIFDKQFRLLNPGTQTLDEMTKAVDLSVSRCCNTVTNHEAALLLLDSQGRLVKRHAVGDPNLQMRAVAEEIRDIMFEDRSGNER